jgi:polyisoprenyl-phosphate glycosyltransferase
LVECELSIVAPMFNEEKVIAAFLDKTLDVLQQHKVSYEIILVDDGSVDATVLSCLPYVRANPMIKILKFSRNYGHEIALTAGIDHARGKYTVFMDTDLQHPPELLPKMLDQIKLGEVDVVCAQRRDRSYQSFLSKILAKSFYWLSYKMTGFAMQTANSNFRMFTKNVLYYLRLMRESNRHIIMMFAYIGFKTAYLPYDCPKRFAGRTKYTFMKKFQLSLDSIIGFSSRPLRIMSIFSVLLSIIMMLYAGFIVLEKLFLRQTLADGMYSIIFLISGLFSVLFLFLALLSEYISRILLETKNRPLYTLQMEITTESLP